MDETQKFCRDCDRPVLARRRATSHLPHLILTILTGGLWVIVWILASVKVGGWRCTTCGGRV